MSTARDKLKAKSAELTARLKALVEMEADKPLTAEEAAEFEAKEAELTRVTASLSRLDKIEDAEDTATKSVSRPARDVTGNIDAVTRGNTVPAQAKSEELTDEQKVGLCAMASATNKHHPMISPLDALDKGGFGELAKACEETKKTLLRTKAFESIGSTTGANTIFTPMSTDFIDFLRNETVILRSQPLIIDLSAGSLDVPGGNAATSGSYHAEGAELAYTQATTREVNLVAKHVGAITAVSNFNLEISPLPLATIIGNDLMMGVTLAMDSAGLRGDGSGSNPTGLRSLINAANIFAATGGTAPTLAQIDTACRNAQLRVVQANIPMRRRRWIMSNRVFMFLKYVRDANGNKAYPSLSDANPTWDGYPVMLTEQVPSNLGAGTNESEIYFVDFGHYLVGIARALALKSSTEATYNDGGGQRNAFQRDQTVIRAMASHDFDVRYDRLGAVITGVQWGA